MNVGSSRDLDMAELKESGESSLDVTAVHLNLSSASTTRRIAQLETLAEELKYRGTTPTLDGKTRPGHQG